MLSTGSLAAFFANVAQSGAGSPLSQIPVVRSASIQPQREATAPSTLRPRAMLGPAAAPSTGRGLPRGSLLDLSVGGTRLPDRTEPWQNIDPILSTRQCSACPDSSVLPRSVISVSARSALVARSGVGAVSCLCWRCSFWLLRRPVRAPCQSRPFRLPRRMTRQPRFRIAMQVPPKRRRQPGQRSCRACCRCRPTRTNSTPVLVM